MNKRQRKKAVKRHYEQLAQYMQAEQREYRKWLFTMKPVTPRMAWNIRAIQAQIDGARGKSGKV